MHLQPDSRLHSSQPELAMGERLHPSCLPRDPELKRGTSASLWLYSLKVHRAMQRELNMPKRRTLTLGEPICEVL